MSEQMTPAQLLALAEFCGVTPETRPDLYILQTGNRWVSPNPDWAYKLRDSVPDPTSPDADPREVDSVYLAGLMWALNHRSLVINTTRLPGTVMVSGMPIPFETSLTLALLRAAQAAGVPQVVDIMQQPPSAAGGE